MLKWLQGVLIVVAAVLVSCNSNPALEDNQPQGRLLVWHPFEGRAANTLNEILDQYTTLHPNVTIVREFVPELQMASRFRKQIESGLGPDMMINSYIRTVGLIEEGFIQALDGRQVDRSIYLDTALSQVQHEGKLYGLPLSMYIRMLCYNRQLVSVVPKNFDGLIEEARAGRRVGVFSTFGATYWGIPALGGRLLDESGRVVLDEGGMAEWYGYLLRARNEPNFIFSRNPAQGVSISKDETLQQVFVEGDMAYYICWSSEIPELQAALGNENVGVAPLPSPNDQPSAPFILTNGIFLSRASASSNKDLAFQLAHFLTNMQQQTKLALETESQIPANNSITIDERLSPTVAALVNQSKTATGIPLDYIQQALAAAVVHGDIYQNLILEGEISPQTAAEELTRIVNEEFGLNKGGD